VQVTIAIPIVTLILGVVLGAWFNNYVKRPRLVVTGGGGGGGPGPGYHHRLVTITNQPGLMGLRLSETVIVGKQIHGHVERGLTIDRNPANQCTASLYDMAQLVDTSRLFGGARRPSPIGSTGTSPSPRARAST
jgi:hypothetical protein